MRRHDGAFAILCWCTRGVLGYQTSGARGKERRYSRCKEGHGGCELSASCCDFFFGFFSIIDHAGWACLSQDDAFQAYTMMRVTSVLHLLLEASFKWFESLCSPLGIFGIRCCSVVFLCIGIYICVLSVSISICLVHFAYFYASCYDMLFFVVALLVNSHSYFILVFVFAVP